MIGVLVDGVLRRMTARASLPPLAVGMGTYLPMSTTLMITVGSVIGMLYGRWAMRGTRGEEKKRQGTLLATSLIVGEALWGVVVFAAITVWLYRRTMRTSTQEAAE